MVAVLVAADFQMMMVSLAEVLVEEVEEAGRNWLFSKNIIKKHISDIKQYNEDILSKKWILFKVSSFFKYLFTQFLELS